MIVGVLALDQVMGFELMIPGQVFGMANLAAAEPGAASNGGAAVWPVGRPTTSTRPHPRLTSRPWLTEAPRVSDAQRLRRFPALALAEDVNDVRFRPLNLIYGAQSFQVTGDTIMWVEG